MIVLAQWHHHGWFQLWPLVPLFWITVVFVLVRLVFWRRGRGPWSASRGPDPRAILAELGRAVRVGRAGRAGASDNRATPGRQSAMSHPRPRYEWRFVRPWICRR